MSRPLASFQVLTFDCYGTLIDWETGIWDALQPLWMANHVFFSMAEMAQAVRAED